MDQLVIDERQAEENDRLCKLRAWVVHFYTALGMIAGFMAAIAIGEGKAQPAAIWLALSCIIDSTDGALARQFRVKHWLPHFDGRKLDDIIDYINYTFLPMLFLYRFGLLPPSWLPVIFFVLLASAYGFCSEAAKTSDGYFTGFPSYWNFVAFYCYALGAPPVINGIILLFWAVMVFVPIKYIYPSQTPVLKWVNLTATAALGVIMVILIIDFEHPNPVLVMISLLYWVYYFGLSFYLHFRQRPARTR